MKDLGQISCFNQTHYDILYSAIKESRGNESIDSAVLSTFGLIAGQFKIVGLNFTFKVLFNNKAENFQLYKSYIDKYNFRPV